MPACSLLFTPALLTGIPSTQIERSPTAYTQLKLHKNIFIDFISIIFNPYSIKISKNINKLVFYILNLNNLSCVQAYSFGTYFSPVIFSAQTH